MSRVLLTGAGGFIGAHCVEYFLENTDWNLVLFDSFRHKGLHQRLIDIVGDQLFDERVEIHKVDLSVPIPAPLENLVAGDKPIDMIINMASNSAVERSTQDPTECLRNNFDLSINMLEFARRIKPNLFIQISTDEVYGEARPGEAHKEWDEIMPSNPYAASKAAQEAVAISYWRTYGVPVVITNTMNVIGEAQDTEKFLPKIIKMVNAGKTMPIYGESIDNIGTRFYLHAANFADALVFISKMPPASYDGGHGADRPDRYNIVGDSELNNLELAQKVAESVGKPLKWELVSSESARPGYDRRYALDGQKLAQLGWKQPISFDESIQRIVKWTLEKSHWTA